MAALLRFYRLGGPSLWIDEIFTWLASGGGGPLAWRDLLGDVHGPLHTLAVHLSWSAFGVSEWALRLPGAVAGVLTVPAIAWVAFRWLGRETAAPAAWLAAASPFLVRYSQEARGYSWVVLGTCASVALLLELQRRCDARGVAAWFLATAFGALSNPSFALLAPLQLRLWLAGDPATRRARRRWLGVGALAALLLAAALAPPVLRTWDWSRLAPARAPVAGESPLRGATTLHPGAIPFALHAFAVGYTLGPSLRELRADVGPAVLLRHAPELVTVTLVFGAAGLLGLAALARRRRLMDALLWLAAPALVVVYFAMQNFKVFNPRYLAVSLPAFLLVVAAGWADRGALGRRLLGGAIALLWAVSLFHHYFDPGYAREDYRAALSTVRRGIAPGEQVLAVGAMEPVDFYGRGLPVRHLWLGFAADSTRLEQELARALSGVRGTWVVLSRSEDLDPAGRFAKRMDEIAPGARSGYPGVRVWHVSRPPDGNDRPVPGN
ncbi:MAG: glycosyltransferase family 39 protein [Candidatus Eisenbacteria bacterium]|nr:glycosyltransferase family 39 protein [Candidatus Eisenbacteria bacterium]